jgi:hypothetical protein
MNNAGDVHEACGRLRAGDPATSSSRARLLLIFSNSVNEVVIDVA